MLIGETLARTAARLPDKPAFVHGAHTISYAELDAAGNRFANALISGGFAPGDTVAILCGNHVPHAVTYFGTARAGGIGAHLSTRYVADEIAHTLRQVEATVAVVDAEFLETVQSLRTGLPNLASIVVVGAGDAPGAVPFDEFLSGTSEAPPALALNDRDSASVTFTGGTTGFPKAALLTHRARTLWCDMAIEWFSLDAADMLAVASPMYHAAGMFIWVQPGILAGATSVLLGHWDVPAFISEAERTGVTGAFLVPAQIRMLIDDPAFDPERLRTLRRIVYGGAPSPPGLIERADSLLPATVFIQNYGQTEIGPVVTLYEGDRARKPDALGYPSGRTEMAVFGSSGDSAPPGEIGELACRGDNVMTGYVNDPDETAAFFKKGDGWGFTGDLAVTEEDGLITLVDRVKDTIIAGGVNIYPAEIERVLFDLPGIAECAVFGVPDDQWGELPVAAVVLDDGAAGDAQEILDACADRVARHKRPRRIHFVDALPKSAAGKVLRTELKRRFGGG